jgi:hypothetical protein
MLFVKILNFVVDFLVAMLRLQTEIAVVGSFSGG